MTCAVNLFGMIYVVLMVKTHTMVNFIRNHLSQKSNQAQAQLTPPNDKSETGSEKIVDKYQYFIPEEQDDVNAYMYDADMPYYEVG